MSTHLANSGNANPDAAAFLEDLYQALVSDFHASGTINANSFALQRK
ncbi:hypothetical protein [Rhodococcus sp. 24CO]